MMPSRLASFDQQLLGEANSLALLWEGGEQIGFHKSKESNS